MSRVPVWAIIAALVAGSACGYGLAGRGVSLPAHIKKIAVQPFTNRTQVADLDRILTDAVQSELINRGKWQVVQTASDPDVDAVVSGTITSVVPTPKAFNDSRQVSRLEIAVTASLEFKDLRDNNKMLWSSPGYVSKEEYDLTAAVTNTDPSAFLRQNQDAYKRLASRFASSVVRSMLEGM